jgi:hypothetical protein
MGNHTTSYENESTVPCDLILIYHEGKNEKRVRLANGKSITTSISLPITEFSLSFWDFPLKKALNGSKDNKITVKLIKRGGSGLGIVDVYNVKVLEKHTIIGWSETINYSHYIMYYMSRTNVRILCKTSSGLWALDVTGDGLNWVPSNLGWNMIWEVTTDGGYKFAFKRNNLYLAVADDGSDVVGFRNVKDSYSMFLLRSIGDFRDNLWCS